MALPTQPNGSSIVPIVGAPRTDNARFNTTAQSEVTLNQSGGTETVTIKVITN